MAQAGAGRSAPSRFWLYAPFVAVALLAAAWSAGWFLIRGRAEGAIDVWLAREAASGRRWTCADRRLGGYPFRLQIDCGSLALERGEASLSLGRVRALAQVYQPRHLIAEIEGPLRLAEGRTALEGEWRLARASLRLASGELGRASLDVTEPRLRLTGLPTGAFAMAGRHLALHARPNVARAASEGAYDLALRAEGTTIPGLDALLGGTEPADIAADTVVTRLAALRPGPAAALADRWRTDGGAVEVAFLSLVKGPSRLEGQGELRLDPERRPAGRLDLSAAGLGGLLGPLDGRTAGAADAVLGRLGARRVPGPAGGETRAQGRRPLPTLRIDGGRVLVGSLPLPGLRVPPLY